MPRLVIADARAAGEEQHVPALGAAVASVTSTVKLSLGAMLSDEFASAESAARASNCCRGSAPALERHLGEPSRCRRRHARCAARRSHGFHISELCESVIRRHQRECLGRSSRSRRAHPRRAGGCLSRRRALRIRKPRALGRAILDATCVVPAGIAEPVKTRAHSPGQIVRSETAPAGSSATTETDPVPSPFTA